MACEPQQAEMAGSDDRHIALPGVRADATHPEPNIEFQPFEQLTEAASIEQQCAADSFGEIAVPGPRTDNGNRLVIDADFRLTDIDELKRLMGGELHGLV